MASRIILWQSHLFFVKTERRVEPNCFYLISITSKSLISVLSMENRSSVLTLWNPYIPAAPGFRQSALFLLSYMTLSMWECPQMNSLGGLL